MCLDDIAEMAIDRNTRWASGQVAISVLARSGIERVIFTNDAVGVAIEFGRGDGTVAVTGVEQGDADHQGAGEAPGVTLCDSE